MSTVPASAAGATGLAETMAAMAPMRRAANLVYMVDVVKDLWIGDCV